MARDNRQYCTITKIVALALMAWGISACSSSKSSASDGSGGGGEGGPGGATVDSGTPPGVDGGIDAADDFGTPAEAGGSTGGTAGGTGSTARTGGTAGSRGSGGAGGSTPVCTNGQQRCQNGAVATCTSNTWLAGTACPAPSACTETSPTTAACSQPGKLFVATAPVGRKLQATTAAGALSTARLAGPRSSVQSFQIQVRGNGGALTGVTATPGALTGAGSNALPASRVTLFRAAFIDFKGVDAIFGHLPAPAESATKDSRVPDPLIPLVDPYTGAQLGQPFSVPADRNEVLFVDVEIPAATPAGTYAGTITVAAGAESVAVPMELVVWDFDLPNLNSIHTYFPFADDGVKMYHAGTYTCYNGAADCWLDPNKPRAVTLVQRYADLLHRHRVDPGQAYLPGPEGDDCSVPTSWAAYDAALAPFMDGSYFSDGIPSGRIDAPFTPGADWGPDADCTKTEYTALARAWAAHLKQKGWFDKVVIYSVDEPDANGVPFTAIAEDALALQAGDADWKPHIMDTVAIRADRASVLVPALGIFCQALAEYANWSYPDTARGFYGRAEWDTLRSQGIELWFYESNNQGHPYPTFSSNALDGLEPTMLMWGSWYERATGLLLWNSTAWSDADPWGPNDDYGKAGDGVLIYPGNHDGLDAPMGSPTGIALDGPIPSYRLKMIRAGLQDWAMFILAEQKGLGDFARQQVYQVYHQLGGCTYEECAQPDGGFYWKTDEVTMNAIRAAIAQAIMQS